MKSWRAQGAIEYLTTYGWMVLVIIIVIALLFTLTKPSVGSNCIPESGYSCTNPSLNASGYLELTFSQSLNLGNITVTGLQCTNGSAAPSTFQVENLEIKPNDYSRLIMHCPITSSAVGTSFSGYLWVQYHSNDLPNEPTLVDNFAHVVLPITTNAGFTNFTSVSTTSTTTGTTTTIVSYSCTGPSIDISSDAVLKNDITTPCNITIEHGVTLRTQGYDLIAGGTFINNGTIITGNSIAISAAGYDWLNNPPSIPASFGGSGGGGGTISASTTPPNSNNGYNGGSTLASGGTGGVSPGGAGLPGSTPTGPPLSSSLINTWYQNETKTWGPIGLTYLGGGAGGFGGYIYDITPASVYPYAGAGIYIQANKVVAGNISTQGGTGYGANCAVPASGSGYLYGPGGGMGGGSIVIAYGNGGYTPGTYNTVGGQPGPFSLSGYYGSCTNSAGGVGGDGAVYAFAYGNLPPVAPQAQPKHFIPGVFSVFDIAFFPSGDYAYAANGNNSISIINAVSNTTTGIVHDPDVSGIAIDPTGSYAYASNFNNTISMINVPTNTITTVFAYPAYAGGSAPLGIAISPSGAYAYVVNNYNVSIFNTSTHAVTGVIGGNLMNNVGGIAFAPSGAYAWVTQYNNTIAVINTSTRTVTRHITENGGLNYFYEGQEVAFAPSGAYAYVTGTVNLDNGLAIMNTSTGATLYVIQGYFMMSDAYGVAFSPSGGYVYVGNEGSYQCGTYCIGGEAVNAITILQPSLYPQ